MNDCGNNDGHLCPVAENVIALVFAYLKECSSEFGNHGWVYPYALLHDRREAVKREKW